MHFYYFYYSLKNLLLFIIPAVLAGHFWGWRFAVGVYAALVLLWVVAHLIQLSFFMYFLYKPNPSKLPKGVGIWQTIFSMLRRREKRRRKQKKRSEGLLRMFYRISALMPAGALILDPSGRIEWMNAPVRRHLGLNEFLDQNGKFSPLFANEDLDEYLGDDDREGEPFFLDVASPATEGEPARILLRRLKYDRERSIIFTQDVTKLVRLDAVRRDFVANVSRELKDPVNAMEEQVRAMIENPDMPAEERGRLLDLMRDEGRRVSSLLDDLIALSRIESQDRERHKVAVCLSELVEGIVEDAVALSGGRQKIVPAVESDLWVSGIPDDLRAGLSNLVVNAVRHVPEGAEIRVRLFKRRFDRATLFAFQSGGYMEDEFSISESRASAPSPAPDADDSASDAGVDAAGSESAATASADPGDLPKRSVDEIVRAIATRPSAPPPLDETLFPGLMGEYGPGDDVAWYAVFEVEDTGPGIPGEHLPRLTERFYRVGGDDWRSPDGTGLGLAIAKHALGEHHSVLRVVSDVGEGSTFSCAIKLFDKPVDLAG